MSDPTDDPVRRIRERHRQQIAVGGFEAWESMSERLTRLALQRLHDDRQILLEALDKQNAEREQAAAKRAADLVATERSRLAILRSRMTRDPPSTAVPTFRKWYLIELDSPMDFFPYYRDADEVRDDAFAWDIHAAGQLAFQTIEQDGFRHYLRMCQLTTFPGFFFIQKNDNNGNTYLIATGLHDEMRAIADAGCSCFDPDYYDLCDLPWEIAAPKKG